MKESSTSTVFDRLREVAPTLKEVSSHLNNQEGQRQVLISTENSLREEVDSLNQRINYLKLIETYLSAFADERQAKVYRQIEHTVSEGLQAVFEEDIRLEVSTKMVGARSETAFTIVSNSTEGELRTSVMDSRGGGVASIVGFLIQAVLVLLTPNLRPILFLDESFRAVSEEYQEPLGEFIRDLCERTGLQVVLVSHQPTISSYADRAYSFSQSDGKTKIKKVI